MLEFIKSIFRRKQLERSDMRNAVQRLICTLPRCSGKVVIVSPRYEDEHYRCDVLVPATALADWAEEHSSRCAHSHDELSIAAKTLPLWLRSADMDNAVPTFLLPRFAKVLRPYASDFVANGIAEIFCPECREIAANVSRMKLNERVAGTWVFWTDEWRCPAGHLLYLENQELHFILRK